MFGKLKALLSSQKGATAVEYGLILALIFLAMVASLSQVAEKTNNMWGNVSNKVSGN
ncbi:Flp family type IVb pilin [Sphingobium sp. CR28]|uniref:Flp family type IVb pilin n=1 Tax=Sphingobium sp. CR28 TaxID=3400272 RepID=UPI003FEFF252